MCTNRTERNRYAVVYGERKTKDGPLQDPPEFACVRRKFPPRPSRVCQGAGDVGRKTRDRLVLAGFFFHAFEYNVVAASADNIVKERKIHGNEKWLHTNLCGHSMQRGLLGVSVLFQI